MSKARIKKTFAWTDRFQLLAILALGLALRVWGIGFGLPDLYHADEPVIVHHALAYGTGDLNPHFFNIPPLVSYLTFIGYGFYFLSGLVLGWFQSADDFLNLFVRDPGPFYLLARTFFGAFLGTLTLLVFYKLIRKFFSKDQALLAGFFLAVSFLHVRDSHYIYTDIPLVFVTILSLFPVFKILAGGEKKDYILFGILAGTAVATKYNGVFVVIPFLAAHFLRNGFKRVSIWNVNLLISGMISLAVFILLNPFAVWDWNFFWGELRQQSGAEGFSGFTHHLIYSLGGGLGLSLLGVSLLGLLDSLTRSDKKRWIFLSFWTGYYLILCFFSQPYDRYVLPLIPFSCFFAADILTTWKKGFKSRGPAVWLLALAVASPSLVKVVLSDYLFTRQDIRSLARERIEAAIPSGSRVAIDIPFFMPRFAPTLAQLEEKKGEILALSSHGRGQMKRIEAMIREGARDRRARYELYFLNRAGSSGEAFLFAKPTLPYDLDALKKAGIQYLIIAKVNEQHESLFYRDLTGRAVLLATFSPYKDKSRRWPIDRQPLTGGPFLLSELLARERNGQIIEVYRLKEF